MSSDISGYEVVRKLADGAVAEVYLARVKGTQQSVVLKVIRQELAADAEAVGRFLDEVSACEPLHHPNVLRYLGAGKLGHGRPFCATEYLEGEDLATHLRKHGPLGGEELSKLALPLCEALQYIHARGIVHRDLKPDNVFLVGGLSASAPKLIDFGLAHFGGPRRVKTAAGVILSTPEYTPPECIEGQQADARSDLYSFGVLMFEALSGRPPFVAGNYSELLLKHLNEAPPPLRREVAYLEPLVHRCLAKKPADRFQSAGELVEALSALKQQALSATFISQHGEEKATPSRGAGAVVGSYELVKLLGEGAMGQVYLARHTRLGRQVALKFLRPEHAANKGLVQRFFQEARTVNQINHEHIVEIHDFVEESGPTGQVAYCVMELLAGRSLSELSCAEPLSLKRAAHLVRQICGALEAAHRVGVVHRDIKPDNVFITERSGIRDFVKVLDFGVAKMVHQVGEAPTGGTLQGSIIGTPAYMAPEQAMGETVDFRADIYAVGAVLYELLAGHPPFDGKTFAQLVVQLTTQPPPPMGSVTAARECIPEGLKAVVLRCLEKEPGKRPSSMAELAELLRPYAEAEAEAEVGAKAPRRARWPLLAGGAAVAAAVAGAVLVWPGWIGERAEPAPVLAAPEQPQAEEPPPKPIEPEVVLSLRSEPAGAEVTRADTGAKFGVTPAEVRLPRGEELALRFELEGSKPEERRLRLDRDTTLMVMLARERAAGKLEKAGKGKKARQKKGSRDDVIDPFAGN
ncbi:MAG: serine/threonine protein kinase [Myxococcales bacterium]|nr:serine/threonine protein kinase [Myxococcales bacterium]